jgi:hypothetical protein
MIYIELDDFCSENIYFKKIIKNKIITNGTFIYLNYVTPVVSLNTIYIKFNTCDIKRLINIEEDFLKLSSKIKQYKFAKCLENISNSDYLLKITGIWESDKYCGVSFKLIRLPKNT